MSRRGQWLLVGSIVVVVTGGAIALSPWVPVPDPVDVGFRAPDFRARTIDGAAQERGLNHYQGSLVLVNVWATWCDPCRREMPSIERLYRELGPEGLRVAAVSLDDAGAVPDIREFVREHDLTFDILHDPTGKIMHAYQMIGVPESFLVGPDGVIRKKAFETDWYSDENRAFVAKLLREGS
ncbi:MAG: TlpA family protein disulfide reductase [Gemmatimonadetes bacterium]|nr:TlpA family protein disulfide reductase [Gemmatimonadota bacterium]